MLNYSQLSDYTAFKVNGQERFWKFKLLWASLNLLLQGGIKLIFSNYKIYDFDFL